MSNEVVIIIRPSLKKICGPDACRAALYNHILYRLARKAKDEPDKKVRTGEVFWYASAEDICQDMDDAWCVNKVRKEIKELVDAGLIGQRHNPLKGWDRKFQYFVSKEQGAKLLEKCEVEGVCLLHIGLNSEVLHLLHMVNAFTKNGACKCQKEEMHLPDMGDAFTINGGAIPEGSSRDQTKGSTEDSLPASASISPKWIVSKAEELRGRIYTDNQRPKELKASEKLLQRKPDLTTDEFEQAFTKRNDAWWKEHVGLLNVTDLAATPKDKNDLRLMLLLEQIEREKSKPALQVVRKPKDELEVFTGVDAIRRQDAIEREEARQRQLRKKGIPA